MVINNPNPPGVSFTEISGGGLYATANNAWEDLDLSGSLPAGAVSALMLMKNYNTTLIKTMGLRQNGSGSSRYWGITFSEGGIVMQVQLDANRIVEIRSSEFGNCPFYLVGYWS